MLGEYIHLFKARSVNRKLRERRGGGVVTQLLIDALEEQMIEKVLLVKSSNKRPWAKAFYAKTLDEVIEGAGSKYIYVPYNKKTTLLKKNDAIVGLPCQCRTIKKNILKIGLFCGLNISPRGYDYIFRCFGLDEKEIKSIEYRSPEGGIKIILCNGESIFIKEYSWLAFFFSYPMCLTCRDHSALYADVSVGDFEPGWSTVIVRTSRGERVFWSSIEKGNIEATPIDKDEVIRRKIHLLMPKEVEGGFIKSRLVGHTTLIEHLPWNITRRLGNIVYYLLRKKYRRYIQ